MWSALINNFFFSFEKRCFIGVVSALFIVAATAAHAAESPAGFFVEDLSKHPPVPAFYNESTGKLDPLTLRGHYVDFIDFVWDAERGRVFFSAREAAGQPFRVYLKEGLDGDEKPIYENPIGPFRFILSPDGQRLALQIMGPSAWPILAVNDWNAQHTIDLGQGYSPDWSPDGTRLLYLHIPDSLPGWLWEYRVDTDTATRILTEPVVESAYAQDAQHLILKTAQRAKRCDMFELWNRISGVRTLYSPATLETGSKKCVSEREVGAFPGHRYFVFKESTSSTERADEMLVITDTDGGRLLEMAKSEWDPAAVPMDPTTLVVGQEPLYLLHADGAGGKQPIPNADFIRPRS